MAIPLSMPNSDDVDESQRLDLLLEQLLITLRQVLMQRRIAAAAAAAAARASARRTTERHRHGGDRSSADEERPEDENEREDDSEDSEEESGADEDASPGKSTRVNPEEERGDGDEEPVPEMQLPLPDLVMGSPSATAGRGRSYRECGVCRCRESSHLPPRSDPIDVSSSGAACRRPRNWIDDGAELIRLAGQLLDEEEVDAKSVGASPPEVKPDERKKMNVLSLVCPLLGNSVWTTLALLVVCGLISHAR